MKVLRMFVVYVCVVYIYMTDPNFQRGLFDYLVRPVLRTCGEPCPLFRLRFSSFGCSLIVLTISNSLSTSSMGGRFFGSASRHRRINAAVLLTAKSGYLFSSRGSINFWIFFFWVRTGLAHSTRFCCADGRFGSSALRPVNSSKRTTPNP